MSMIQGRWNQIIQTNKMHNSIKMQKKRSNQILFLIFYKFFYYVYLIFLFYPIHCLLFNIWSNDLNDNTMTFMKTLCSKEIKEQIKLRTQRLLHKSRL